MAGIQAPQEESDTAGRALHDFVSWVTSNKSQFEGQEEPSGSPPSRYLGRWESYEYIAVFRPDFNGMMERMRYSPEAVLGSWRDQGWIRHDPGRFTEKVRVRGVPQHMIVVDWPAAAEAIGIHVEEEEEVLR